MLKTVKKGLQQFASPALAMGIAALLIIAVAAVASGPAAPALAAEKGGKADKLVWHETPLPLAATVFKDAADADQTLAGFSGKVLLVNFWATWCAPCVKEMPTLDNLQKKLGGPGFQVIAISQDREGAKVAKPFKDKNEWNNLAFYIEPRGRFQKDANMRGLPTTLIIDKSGREVARAEGEVEWDSPEVEKIIRDLMKKGG